MWSPSMGGQNIPTVAKNGQTFLKNNHIVVLFCIYLL